MKLRLTLAIAVLLALVAGPPPAQGARVKDISQIHGVRDNQLVGYGLVTGLRGTGDTPRSTFTTQSLSAMLAGMGINVDPEQVRVRNVAAVMVTATLPPFSRTGNQLDVTVSSIGDARSLEGGTLLMTPLKAANGDVYAVAQGPISVGGFNVQAAGSRMQQNFPNVGRIPKGALVEREVPFSLGDQESLELTLHAADFTTAVRTATAVNDAVGSELAKAVDAGTVVIDASGEWSERMPELIATIEAAEVQIDSKAKVIVNERTGTVVVGEEVRISKVAIAHGNLTIQIQLANTISQPQTFGQGQTALAQNAAISANQGQDGLRLVDGATIGEVVGALNALGVSPRDLIVILQSLRAAGALQADIEII